MPKTVDDVADLKREIAKLTKRVPVSNNRRYLQIRLAELKRREPSDLPRARPSAHAAPRSISLGSARSELLDKLAARSFGGNVSACIARALDEYAVRVGLGADVERIRRAES